MSPVIAFVGRSEESCHSFGEILPISGKPYEGTIARIDEVLGCHEGEVERFTRLSNQQKGLVVVRIFDLGL